MANFHLCNFGLRPDALLCHFFYCETVCWWHSLISRNIITCWHCWSSAWSWCSSGLGVQVAHGIQPVQVSDTTGYAKHKPVEASYMIHGQTPELVEFTKYLGVTTDSKQNFNNHIDSVTKKANGTRAFLNHNLRSCSTASETQPTKRTFDRCLSMHPPSGILTPTETSTLETVSIAEPLQNWQHA